MSALLWAAQAVLALLFLSGGAFKLFSVDQLAEVVALPRAVWSLLGTIEVVGSLLLVIPAATKRMPVLTPLAAAVLALESLGLAALYASHSLDLAVTNPMPWALVMGLLAAFVAWGRYRLAPV